MSTQQIILILIGVVGAVVLIAWRMGALKKSKRPPVRTAPIQTQPQSTKTFWRKCRDNQKPILLAGAALVGIVLVVWLWDKRNDSPSTDTAEAPRATPQTMPPAQAQPREMFLIATRSGSDTIRQDLGRRYEWGPTAIVSYAVKYETYEGDTATVHFPAHPKEHKELPYPLKWMQFLSTDRDSVTIVLRVM